MFAPLAYAGGAFIHKAPLGHERLQAMSDETEVVEEQAEIWEPELARFRRGEVAWIVYVGGSYDHEVVPQVLRKDPHTLKPIKRKVLKSAQLKHIHQDSVVVAGVQAPSGIEFPLGRLVQIPRVKPNKKGKFPGRCIVAKCEALSAFEVFDELPEQIALEETDEEQKVSEMAPMHDELAFPGQYDPEEMDMKKGKAGDLQVRSIGDEESDKAKGKIQKAPKPAAKKAKVTKKKTGKKVTKKTAAK